MDSILIAYDLNKQGQDYTTLIKEIKTLGKWWHCLDSTFIVKTNRSCVEIRDFLKKYIDSNDELLVVKLTGEGAWTGFTKDCSVWLKDNL